MNINVTNYEKVTVLSVKDDLVGDVVDLFNEQANRCLDDGRYNIVVDCTAIGGFDSSALESFLLLQSKCEEQLGAAKLCGLNETCGKILEITRIARRFELFEDLESAVRSFG